MIERQKCPFGKIPGSEIIEFSQWLLYVTVLFWVYTQMANCCLINPVFSLLWARFLRIECSGKYFYFGSAKNNNLKHGYATHSKESNSPLTWYDHVSWLKYFRFDLSHLWVNYEFSLFCFFFCCWLILIELSWSWYESINFIQLILRNRWRFNAIIS